MLFFSKIELTTALLKKIQQDGADNSFFFFLFSAFMVEIVLMTSEFLKKLPKEYLKNTSRIPQEFPYSFILGHFGAYISFFYSIEIYCGNCNTYLVQKIQDTILVSSKQSHYFDEFFSVSLRADCLDCCSAWCPCRVKTN